MKNQYNCWCKWRVKFKQGTFVSGILSSNYVFAQEVIGRHFLGHCLVPKYDSGKLYRRNGRHKEISCTLVRTVKNERHIFGRFCDLWWTVFADILTSFFSITTLDRSLPCELLVDVSVLFTEDTKSKENSWS